MDADESIIKLLIDSQKIDTKNLSGVQKIHEANKAPLEKLVVNFKLARREDVLEAKASHYGGEPYLVQNDKIDKETARTIPHAMATRYNLICPGVGEDGRMIIAMYDPTDAFALEQVQMRTGKEVKPYVALLADIESAWDIIYAEEIKKTHPFFTKKKADAPKKEVKVIPSKLSIPGLSKTSTVVAENDEMAQEVIRQATDSIKLKAKDDEQFTAMVDTLRNELKVLAVLSRSESILNSSLSEQEVVRKILETGLQICDGEGASILMLEEDKFHLYFREALGAKSSEIKSIRIPLNDQSIAGWVVINRAPVAVNDASQDPRHYKEVDKAIDFETHNLACVPIMWGEEAIGVLEVVNKRKGQFNEKDLEYLGILANQAAVALHNSMLIEQFQNFYMEVVEILIDCLESLDPVNKYHAIEVARLTSALAKEVRLTGDDYENLCYAGFLHDLGMIKVSQENWKDHPVLGAMMLSHIKFFQQIAPLVRHHHERFDGTGFPDGLSGESIPVGARILAVAEGYIEGRSRKGELTDEEFTREFLGRFGTAYDPGLKLAFIAVIENLRPGPQA